MCFLTRRLPLGGHYILYNHAQSTFLKTNNVGDIDICIKTSKKGPSITNKKNTRFEVEHKVVFDVFKEPLEIFIFKL